MHKVTLNRVNLPKPSTIVCLLLTRGGYRITERYRDLFVLSCLTLEGSVGATQGNDTRPLCQRRFHMNKFHIKFKVYTIALEDEQE